MENLEKYEKACRVAAQAREYGRKLIKKQTYLLDAVDKIEKYIQTKAEIAFPTQISLNQVAAHFYPEHDDETVFEDQICKLDVGVHVDGFIGDNACTVDLSGEYSELVDASKKALKDAIATVHAGVKVSDIGKAIQDAISSYGYAPVRNLGGHGLDSYEVHTSPSIPNTETGSDVVLEKGQIVAIEPFASTGAGVVIETSNPTLFSMQNEKPVRNRSTREILQYIKKYNGLPFAKRWLVAEFPLFKVNFALKRLRQLDIVKAYPPLADQAKGMISQAEHTILVEDEGARILTKI